MKDITLKPDSLRCAIATATLKAPPECIALLRSGETEKGDALKTARVAGILAAKRCDEMIPLCHPLPIYSSEISFVLDEAAVHIQATVETIAATGVEMEALLAANVAALTIYDMLKPHTEQENLLLTWIASCCKTGGKTRTSDGN
ncbi:MAG: cyclic pyranopterin monophosphate synthase MoaC [Pseudomonadales bacterium]